MQDVIQEIQMRTKTAKDGFTLIELLIVIVIVAILAMSIFVALNPIQRLKDARDARRRTDVDTLLTAILQYVDDNKGTFPTLLRTGMTETQIGTGATGCNFSNSFCTITPTACIDLTTSLAKYLKSIPKDPSTSSAQQTQYTVVIDTNNIITIKACGTEGTTLIQESR